MTFRDKFYEILRNPHGSLMERGRLARLFRNELPVFVVNSGNWAKFPELTLNSANELPSQLTSLFGLEKPKLVNFDSAFPETEKSRMLGTLFESLGSDKKSHGYERIYTDFFKSYPDRSPIALLEIGIGTNSPRLISSMGRNGKPGASLKAFSKFDSRINVIGADIDRKILFNDVRINCFYLNQNDSDSYLQLSELSGVEKFDLIIDDGLHSTYANLNSLSFAQKYLSPGGCLIIEDIPDRTLPLWNFVVAMLQEKGNDLFITRALKCNVIIYKKSL